VESAGDLRAGVATETDRERDVLALLGAVHSDDAAGDGRGQERGAGNAVTISSAAARPWSLGIRMSSSATRVRRAPALRTR
jgi:hypothetical protein